ncbi:MAG: GNAT family N-acetyltransferase [Defluviitaleaceae bacterium]|nr:GNAT family N-acetyltransferase [Defluviitaleaceae bacterium]
MRIERYAPENERELFELIKAEGEEWTYWQGDNWARYKKALESSTTYLLFEDKRLCGYLRLRDDGGFGVYVYDLLVDKNFRGNDYGRHLMERVCHDFPENTVYVLGDVYTYYEDKLGYDIEGKVYIVKPKAE